MVGEKTQFSLDRFTLNWKERDAIGVIFTSEKEINEFYLYLSNIGFNMSDLPLQEKAIEALEDAVHYAMIWKGEAGKEHSLGADLTPAESDYYYSDIIFDTYADVNISYSDLMNFLGGN